MRFVKLHEVLQGLHTNNDCKPCLISNIRYSYIATLFFEFRLVKDAFTPSFAMIVLQLYYFLRNQIENTYQLGVGWLLLPVYSNIGLGGDFMKKEMIEFCRSHIKSIKEELSVIYSIDCPDGYPEGRSENGKINTYKELKYLENVEELYSVIDDSECTTGDIYDKYNAYLSKVRESKEIIKEKHEVIEDIFSHDIENANKLIDKFNEYININSAH